MAQIQYIPAKTIVTRTKGSGWFGTDYNMNIYRGCSHGCIYCDSRSDCYGTVEFDQVKVKENALELIRNDLRRKVKPGVVGTGAMSDPYNPLERELLLTRHALELLSAYSFGTAIATKSDLVLRDVDVLKEIKEHSPVMVKLTITAADDGLSRQVEPHVIPSGKRFAALEQLSKEGIFAGVLLMPVLPFLEDNWENVGAIVRRAASCGARFVYPAFGMTLRQNQRDYYLERVEELFPGMAREYNRRYGGNYNCVSPRAKELWQQFTALCVELGILYQMPDIIRLFKMGYGDNQLRFF